jgi:hypothetical protein
MSLKSFFGGALKAVGGVAGGIFKTVGSVLSIVPAVGPLVGGLLSAVGSAVDGKKKTLVKGSATSTDKVTEATNALLQSQNIAKNALAAGKISAVSGSILDFIKNNVIYIMAGIASLFLIFKFVLPKKRR